MPQNSLRGSTPLGSKFATHRFRTRTSQYKTARSPLETGCKLASLSDYSEAFVVDLYSLRFEICAISAHIITVYDWITVGTGGQP